MLICKCVGVDDALQRLDQRLELVRAAVRALDDGAEQVDLVHARSRAPAWSAWSAAKRTRIPFVTTFHGTYSAGNAFKRLYNSVMVRGEPTIATSEFIARHIGISAADEGDIPPETLLREADAALYKAKESGRKIKVGRFPFIGNGKAIALGEAEGLIKTVFDATTGELLGAHMIGAEVTELIQGYVIAKTGELTDQELSHTIFPHPTLSEMMHEAVLAADGGALHI